jgi:signal transduction histidine kinase
MTARLLAFSRHPHLQRLTDYLLAAALLVGSLVDLFHGGPGNGWSGWRPLEIACAFAISVPLLWRRSRPAAVLWIVLAAGATNAALVAPRQAGFEPLVALLVAYYSLGANAKERSSLLNATLALGISLIGGIATVAAGEEKLGNTLPILVFTFAAWLIGRIIRSWRFRAAELEHLNRELEEQRELQAQAAVVVERGRIARELHDVIAHNISMIVVQAGAAARVLEGEQPHVSGALEAIEATGRKTVDEMRRLLGVLRRADDGLALAPQPDLDDLEALAAQVGDAGLSVDLRVEGAPTAVPPGVGLSAYRIVQEALTNALKHGHATRADVTVRYTPGVLELEVRDDGSGTESANGGGGHGLIGMRERVALWGGDLAAGREQTGWTVRARLPTGPAA